MFGLFKTKPPLGPLEKAWTEHHMSWLADKFGMSRLLETPTLVPDYAGIPNATNYNEALELLEFLRTWIKLDAQNVRLQIHGQVVSPEMIAKPDDIENPIVVSIEEDDFQHRDTLVAALARGLAHGALAEGGVNPAADNGWTAELLPAFLGLGAFAANATIHDSSYSDAIYTSWSVARRGPLPSRIFGYAMALRSFVRRDQDSAKEWSPMLRQDAKVAFEEGLKYLSKTDDSTFRNDPTQQPRDRMSLEAFADEVQDGSDSLKIAGMWGLAGLASKKTFERHERVSELLVDCCRSRDADVRSVAVATLSQFDRSPHAAQEIAEALSDPSSDVRASAAGTLGDFAGVDDETLVQDLMTALKDDSDDVVLGSLSSLTKFGEAAEPAIKIVLSRLRRAFVQCNNGEASLFLHVLVKTTSNPEERIREHFRETDDEYLSECLAMLEEVQAAPLEPH